MRQRSPEHIHSPCLGFASSWHLGDRLTCHHRHCHHHQLLLHYYNNYSKNKGHKVRPKPELQAERKSEFRMQDANRAQHAQRTLHEDEERSRLTFRRGGDKVSKCTSFGPGQHEKSIFEATSPTKLYCLILSDPVFLYHVRGGHGLRTAALRLSWALSPCLAKRFSESLAKTTGISGITSDRIIQNHT